jgi:hypothetical protein
VHLNYPCFVFKLKNNSALSNYQLYGLDCSEGKFALQ